MIKIVVCILCSVLGVIGSPPLGAVTPPFSYMTLSGTSRIALTVEDIDRDFAIYGLKSEQVVERVTAALTAGGITVVPYASALTEQQTALLRVRIMTNHDAHGFYHLSVKLELWIWSTTPAAGTSRIPEWPQRSSSPATT